MARFNTTRHQTKPQVALATSPIATVSSTPDTLTHEGAPGWSRTAKSELFLRASGAFHGGEGSFYESAEKRDERLRELVRTVALTDPQWGLDFATWLRGPGNMRTGSLMFAVDFVKARLDSAVDDNPLGTRKDAVAQGQHAPGMNRAVINAVCQRPDEPGELLSIWTAWYGRRVPKPVKRGLADAERRLFHEKSLLKYDTSSHSYRFADVLNITHPAPAPGKLWQGDLFQYALDRRHHPSTAVIPERLEIIRRNASLRDSNDTSLWLNGTTLHAAGITWEDALSAVGDKVDKAKLWTALIPSMGIMAQLRNLRNFDRAGVPDDELNQVLHKLQDPQEIAKSRQFPFRFLAAYRAVKDAGSLRWLYPLEQALNHSLANVPALSGRTLILVDRSPSMFPGYYQENATDKRLGVSRADQAAIFGSALALRAEEPTLAEFGGEARVIPVPKAGSVLPLVETFTQIPYTDIATALSKLYANHDRVIIVTDEQTRAGYLPALRRSTWGNHYEKAPDMSIDALVPLNVPVFMWNLAGYTASAMESGKNARFTLGGLTDSAFRLIPILESGAAGVWPWQLNSQGQ